ncbi:MAG: MFS transporter, partial [Gemmatimonadota bacterium]
APAEVGLAYGLISLICGPAGVFAGGWVSDRLWKNGRTDATLRTAMYGALALLPFAVIAPFMPTGGLAIALAVPITFLFAFPFGVAAAAIQLVATPAIRAQVTAIYLFFGTLIGLGAGPTVVALVTQQVFVADDQLRYAVALVAGVVIPLAALAFRSGLAPLRRMVGTDAAH